MHSRPHRPIQPACVSLMLACVASILILGACGFGPATARPFVVYETFLLKAQPVPGGPYRIVGHGSIGGGGRRVKAELVMYEPACLAGHLYSLSGTWRSIVPDLIVLRQEGGPPSSVALTGHAAVFPAAGPVGLSVLPLDGTLQVDAPCVPARFPFAAESFLPRKAALQGFGKGDGGSLDLSLEQWPSNSPHSYYVAVEFGLSSPNCKAAGVNGEWAPVAEAADALEMPVRDEKSGAEALLRLEHSPFGPGGVSAGKASIAFTAGPCKGRAFEYTVHPR